ncbi:MAG: hypothetical protein U1F48_12460 [Burkholderiales bacterium]
MSAKPPPPRLVDLVGQDHTEDALLVALLADPTTARLVVAWRKSIADLEAARQAAIDAGNGDLVRRVDGAVRAKSDGA